MYHDILCRIRRIVGIVLSLLLVMTGVLLIVSCVHIYQSGNSPFTRESVATHFSRIAIPVWITVAVAVIGGILSLFDPVATAEVRPLRSLSARYRRMVAPYDLSSAPSDVRGNLAREASLRRRLRVMACAVWVVAAIPPLVWCLIPGHFGGKDKTADIRAAAVVVLAAAAVAIVATVVLGYLRHRSHERSIATLKGAIAQKQIARAVASGAAQPARSGETALWAVRGVLLVAAVVCIVLGVRNGGMADVLGKAIRICTECIGLG